MSRLQPVIIKKKSSYTNYHGGAWKVAYADFVTALMALFIVLWLMSSSEKVRQAVAGYFNDPKGTASLMGTTMSGNGHSATHQAGATALKKLKEKLEKEIEARKDLKKLSKQITMTVTPQGLRIELIEGKNGTFYELGSPRLSSNGQKLLALLAFELKNIPNSLLIEGYTDSTPYSKGDRYSNWDLSTDRANAARRLLQQDGVRPNQVTQVRGYADMMPRDKNNPADPSNRRVSILVKNSTEPVSILSAANVVDGKTPLPKNVVTAMHAAEPVSKPAGSSTATPAKKTGFADKIKAAPKRKSGSRK